MTTTERLQRAWTALVLNDVAAVRARQGAWDKPDISDNPAEWSHWAVTKLLLGEVRNAVGKGEVLREGLITLIAALVAWVENIDQRAQRAPALRERDDG